MSEKDFFTSKQITKNENPTPAESVDFIPEGSFYADGDNEMTRERIFAIRLVEKMGKQIAIDHPEIGELYKDPTLRLIDIAYQILGQEEVDRYPEVCKKAIGWAIRQINPTEEQAELTKQHRQHGIELNFDFTSPEFIEQCKEAAKKRHELHGVDVEAMIRGRGREPWTVAEKMLVNELIGKTEFQHQEGSIKGTPDYEKITRELNLLFHNGQEVRTSNALASLVRDGRRRKNQAI